MPRRAAVVCRSRLNAHTSKSPVISARTALQVVSNSMSLGSRLPREGSEPLLHALMHAVMHKYHPPRSSRLDKKTLAIGPGGFSLIILLAAQCVGPAPDDTSLIYISQELSQPIVLICATFQRYCAIALVKEAIWSPKSLSILLLAAIEQSEARTRIVGTYHVSTSTTLKRFRVDLGENNPASRRIAFSLRLTAKSRLAPYLDSGPLLGTLSAHPVCIQFVSHALSFVHLGAL